MTKSKSTNISPLQKVESTVKRYIFTALTSAILMAVIGAFMIIFPELSLDILRWGLVVILIALGTYAVVSDLTKNSIFTMFTGSIGGVLMLVLGLIIAMHPGVLSVIPIILGVVIIVSSTFSLRLSTSLRSASATGFYISMLTSVVAIVCGIVLILNPFGGAIALTTFVGIMLVIYAIASMVDLFVLRSHLHDLSKQIKTRFSHDNANIIEAEVEEEE